MTHPFTLYNLDISIVGDPESFVCSHTPGKAFQAIGERLIFNHQSEFSLYALAALLPLLPAKQRMTKPNDWMTTDERIACPDPHCGARFAITRTGITTFYHESVTRVPFPREAA